MFRAKSLVDLTEYKWNTYAKQIHYIGFVTHLVYLIVFSYHVSQKYVYREQNNESIMRIIQFLCLKYPLIYDMTQLKKQGFKAYFK